MLTGGGDYSQFARRDKAEIAMPKKEELTWGTYPNDDVDAEHYWGASRSLAGGPTKGVIDDHPHASPMGEHVEGALRSPSF